MIRFLKHRSIAVWLFGSLMLCLQSCEDQGAQPEKQKVQFTFSTGAMSNNGRANDIDLPENTRLRISIETGSGTAVFTNHEVEVLKAGDRYMADPVELLPGSYVITDFMLTNDGELLYATPKAGSPLSAFVTHAVPHNFTVTKNSVANVNMQVIDGREHTPEELGYVSFSANVVNILSMGVFTEREGHASLTKATAELRQQKKLIKTFSLDASINTIGFEGDPDAEYTLAVYTKDEARVMNFNFRELKEGLGTSPLKVTLEPALIMKIESYFFETNDWEDYFELALEGTGGTINTSWGDGSDETGTLPYTGSHQYTYGTYTAIVTGDIQQITNLWGFAYETNIMAIDGFTNLTALKVFSPSWGAVPIHVDLSNCENLETIFIEKYGAPYDPIDLRTDFKLPSQHFIDEFVFYASGLLEFRGQITAEELDVMVTNIYNNTTQRHIYDGRFIVYPVSDPLPETQRMLDVLQNDYRWEIGLNSDEIYDENSAGRVRSTLEARREKWLRDRSSNHAHTSRSAKMAFMN